MKVIVLEPNGAHWTTEIAFEALGQPLYARDPNEHDMVISDSPYRRQPVPSVKVVVYEPLTVIDGDGNGYRLYLRKKEQQTDAP